MRHLITWLLLAPFGVMLWTLAIWIIRAMIREFRNGEDS